MTKNLIEVSEESGVRYLHFSSEWVQGAMRIQRPNALELPYTRDMMAGLLFHEPPWPKNALLIGLDLKSTFTAMTRQRILIGASPIAVLKHLSSQHSQSVYFLWLKPLPMRKCLQMVAAMDLSYLRNTLALRQ